MTSRKKAAKAGAMKRKGLSEAASKRIAGVKKGKKK
jgi:hypothetical protein